MTGGDVLIVGLGAAGALAAHVLSEAGCSVIGVEAGGWTPAPQGWFARSLPTVRAEPGALARTVPRAPRMANAVGGSKHLSANQSYRLPQASMPRWPLSAAELEPYHRRVERLFDVRESPPSAWLELMGAAAGRLGWSPFPAPVATAAPIGRSLLDPALADGRLRVLTDAVALELITGPDGAIAGVRVRHEGRQAVLHARRVVLAAHAYESVRLLLLSRPASHPAGLGNRCGQVGAHFATHSFIAVHGLFPGRDLGRADGRPGHATAVAEFDADRIDCDRLGFAGGSLLQASMGSAPAALTGLDPATSRSVGTVWAQPEQTPRHSHRLDLDPTHRDPLGRPVLRATHRLAPEDMRRAVYLQDRIEEWLREAGATQTWRARPRAQTISTHVYGGTRMGDDPTSSVVDADLIVHDTPGLTVLGGSTFPSTGGRGPTQTIEALAWRAAERLARGMAGA